MRKFGFWIPAISPLETHAEEIAAAMKEFLETNGIAGRGQER